MPSFSLATYADRLLVESTWKPPFSCKLYPHAGRSLGCCVWCDNIPSGCIGGLRRIPPPTPRPYFPLFPFWPIPPDGGIKTLNLPDLSDPLPPVFVLRGRGCVSPLAFLSRLLCSVKCVCWCLYRLSAQCLSGGVESSAGSHMGRFLVIAYDIQGGKTTQTAVCRVFISFDDVLAWDFVMQDDFVWPLGSMCVRPTQVYERRAFPWCKRLEGCAGGREKTSLAFVVLASVRVILCVRFGLYLFTSVRLNRFRSDTFLRSWEFF